MSSKGRLIERDRLFSIVETSQRLSSILDLDELVDHILSKAIEAVSARATTPTDTIRREGIGEEARK